VRKSRADVDDSGVSIRDLSKPIVSNVTAQTVQANMVFEDNDHVPSDQKSASTPTAKMYTYHSGTVPSSTAHLSGKARVNFAQFYGGRVPDLITEFDPTFLSNDTLVNHYDLDTDIFFDVCEVFGDDANAKKVDDHELKGNKVSTPRNSSRFLPISISRRTAQCGKSALLALKYIATHELAGVLQPIAVPYTCQNDKFKSVS
jgi:hypothetical protein